MHRALFPLYYVGIGRHENKFNKSCNSLATHKLSVSKSQCSICRHNKQTNSFILTTTITHANHHRPRQLLLPRHHCRQWPLPSPAINDCSPPPRHTLVISKGLETPVGTQVRVLQVRVEVRIFQPLPNPYPQCG